jgi:hypothetical protein
LIWFYLLTFVYSVAVVFVVSELFYKFGMRTQTFLLSLIYLLPSWFLYKLRLRDNFCLTYFLKTVLVIVFCFSIGLWIKDFWIKENYYIIFDRDDSLARVLGKIRQNKSFKNVTYEVSRKKILLVYGQVKSEAEFDELTNLLETYEYGYINRVRVFRDPVVSP